MENEILDENGNIISTASVGNVKTTNMNATSEIPKSKKTVFEFDRDEIYDLFMSHGLPVRICDIFLRDSLNGPLFYEWLHFQDFNKLKQYLQEKYTYKSINVQFDLTDNEARHIYSILAKYRINPYNSKHKIIGDSVHGQINVHPLLIKIIDTPQFQRLRYIKQLGTLCYVYPTGNHSRFEHSIGTSHIAGLLMEHFRRNQPGLQITLGDELCVKIAGLCHDLGHGPFSHMFEEVIEELCPETNWKHEKATLMMFEKMLKTNEHLKEEFESYGLFESDLQLIKDLIYAPVFKSADNSNMSYSQKLMSLPSMQYRGPSKSFLFEIISNYRNGIDVDKFDYFERDSLQMGFKNTFNFKRYILCTRVIRTDDNLNQICIRDKDINELYEMFHVRENLTRRAYKHETASSINQMVVEALVKANKFYKFSDMIEKEDIDVFEKLTDNVFLEIVHSTNETLKESREILERVGRRKLYKYVGTTVLPGSKNNKDEIKELKENLKQYLAEKEITDEHSVIEVVRFNYGSKDKNPIENVKCYNKYTPNRAFKIEQNQISGMLLTQFEDVCIRVYSKKVNDFGFFDLIHKFFCEWCPTVNLPNPLYGNSSNDN